MTSQQKAKGIIFDFDGVVVDSVQFHLMAWDIAARELYNQVFDDPNSLIGKSTQTIAGIIANFFGRPETAFELAEKKRLALQQTMEQVPALPGIPEFFYYLDKTKIPYGIVSNAPRSFIEKVLQQLQAKVPLVMGIEDTGRPKPAPDGFLRCASQLNISPVYHQNIFVFEDSTHGLKAAVDASMTPVGITTHHSDTILRAAGAALTFPHLRAALEQKLNGSLD